MELKFESIGEKIHCDKNVADMNVVCYNIELRKFPQFP